MVFVCSGNMVRSAFAHLYAEHLGIPLRALSLGTQYRNDAIFPETARALSARGVPTQSIRAFRPTHVDDGLQHIDPAAVLFVMRHHHVPPLGIHTPRTFLLMEILGSATEIADPVVEGADFDRVFAQVERCVDALVSHLRG